LYFNDKRFVKKMTNMFKEPLFFLFSITPLFSQHIFISDFELGHTLMLHEIDSNSKSIEIIHNNNLQEWPIEGGLGLIDEVPPQVGNLFRFEKRIGNVLWGVKGIRKNHSPFSELRTSHFEKWDIIGNSVSISPHHPIHGKFSAIIPMDSGAGHNMLMKKFKPKNQIWGRFYVSLDKKAAEGLKIDYGWFFEVPAKFRIGMSKKKKCFVLRVHTGKSLKYHEDRYLEMKEALQPDLPYCIEFYFKGGSTGGASFYVNGRLIGESLDNVMTAFQNADAINFGRFSWDGFPVGTLKIDDVALGNSRIGPIPPAPGNLKNHIHVSSMFLEYSSTDFSNAFKNSDSLIVQWQMFVSNGTGINKYNLPFTDFGHTVKKISLSQIVLNQPLLRARIKNNWGHWGDWSIPVSLELNESIKSLSKGKMKFNLDLKALGDMNGLPVLEKGAWFKVSASFEKHLNMDKMLYFHLHHHSSTADDLIHSARLPESAYFGFMKFQKKSNYAFAFDLEKQSIYSVVREGIGKTYQVQKNTFPFIDGKKTSFFEKNNRQNVAARMRLSVEAVSGLWLLDALYYDSQKNHKIFRKPFYLLSKNELSQNISSKTPWWIFLSLIFVCLLCAAFIYYYKKREANLIPYSISKMPTNNSWGKKIYDYIDKNMHNPKLNSEELAKAFNCSRASFSHQFNKTFNMTFPQFVTKLRIEKSIKKRVNFKFRR